ncbi:hypothetical protein LWI29_006454 [Acer saccharum]|uniref:CCAAT-binding factor domain-containing protein n=1 Tax=Acer saccharum TaxID=4024 RepID=A0AA39RV02_ACESA|nr:hypothetical protein LWI29_006454 [Acer saccharum]
MASMLSTKKRKQSLKELKSLGLQLLSSRAHVNNLPLLITFVSPASPPQHLLESLLSLQSFFTPVLPQFPPSSSKKNRVDGESKKEDPEFIYKTWLRSKFDELVRSLIHVLFSPQSEDTLRVDDKTMSANGNDERNPTASIELRIHKIHHIISNIPLQEGNNEKSKHEMWSGSGIVKRMKMKFTKAWIAFLRLPLPIDIYREVLVIMHQAVIPFLSNPLMLCDFLTRSYDIGGVVSVMALSSLFILMTQHGLEYPNFYEKLYALLVPSIFMAKHRAKFLQVIQNAK